MAERCAVCHRYTRAEGSEMCAPCLSTSILSRGQAPASCAACVGAYFEGMDEEPPGRRYRDPMCSKATPWCALYERILSGVAANAEGLAARLSHIRTMMQGRRGRRA